MHSSKDKHTAPHEPQLLDEPSDAAPQLGQLDPCILTGYPFRSRLVNKFSGGLLLTALFGKASLQVC